MKKVTKKQLAQAEKKYADALLRWGPDNSETIRLQSEYYRLSDIRESQKRDNR